MASALQLQLGEFVAIDCYKCAMVFFVPKQWDLNRRDDHVGFFCPNGHNQSYIGKSEAEKLKVELAREQQRHQATLARANEEAARADKIERANKRLLKRASAGVCPCCTRTFQNLARHMQTKHKDAVQ